jgi:uncharacterized protein (TIGR00730 family)
MIENAASAGLVSLADEDAVKQVLVKSVFGLWDIVNDLTRLRPTRRDRYRVTIFGSARAQPGTVAFEEVKRIAAVLAELGCDIITGGGPGLMQAANEGAHAAQAPERSQSIGIRVDLPFEQDVNPFVEQMFEHKTFFTRLHHFVLTSDAFVVAPGGIGTVLELMMVWQLLQVRHVHDAPLILVGKMWADLVEWAKTHLLTTQPPLASISDLAIPRCANTADEAINMIRAAHDQWQTQKTQAGSTSQT